MGDVDFEGIDSVDSIVLTFMHNSGLLLCEVGSPVWCLKIYDGLCGYAVDVDFR